MDIRQVFDEWYSGKKAKSRKYQDKDPMETLIEAILQDYYLKNPKQEEPKKKRKKRKDDR